MNFKSKLNLKFYISSIVLSGMVALIWYALYFINTNEIMMEDAPMDSGTKMFFSAAFCVVALSWTLSLFTVLRQWLRGYGFYMDNDGICSTATAVNIFALIFIVPIRKIPYSAIKRMSYENGILTLHIDKSNIDVFPLFRIFVNKSYHFFHSFTSTEHDEIKAELLRHLPGMAIENEEVDF